MVELEIFAQAISISNREERSRFLDQQCGGNAELRQRLEKLLDAHFRSQPQVVDEKVQMGPGIGPSDRAIDLSPTLDSGPSAEKGMVIAGKYVLGERIGEGGMGEVWVAEQREPVKRKVALKLIKAGMDSRSVLARFEAERQALAVLDHAHIAKVLDGGTTSQGKPFFAMELVKGIPFTEYCDQCHLTVRQRLELFTQVCSAVQHAHQKGTRIARPTRLRRFSSWLSFRFCR